MGKKKRKSEQEPQKVKEQEKEIEGKYLLGKPKFKKLENGRYKCFETGHELPADAREIYAHTKHCRIGLIDSALARNKPPLNMFCQDPLSRSRLICKLTGHTVNKIEEHIWKHINGKRFLNMLEKEEAKKEVLDVSMEDEGDQKPETATKSKGDDDLKKKKKKKQKKEGKEEKGDSKIISEDGNPRDKNSDTDGEDFWMPPVGERWDFDDGKDRWASDPESDEDSYNDDAYDEEDDTSKESHNTNKLFKRTKIMSMEMGPSDTSPTVNAKKIKFTHDTTFKVI